MPYHAITTPFADPFTNVSDTAPQHIQPTPRPPLPQRHEQINDILDEQAMFTGHGGFQRYHVKWKGHPVINSTWLTQKELRSIDPDLLERYRRSLAPEATPFQMREVDEDIRPMQPYRLHYRRRPIVLPLQFEQVCESNMFWWAHRGIMCPLFVGLPFILFGLGLMSFVEPNLGPI